MPKAYIEFGTAVRSAPPLHDAVPRVTEALSISSSAAVSTNAAGKAQSRGFNVVRITVDADCWLAFGPTPNVDNANLRRVLLANSSMDVLLPEGHKVAVKALV
ncbi:hypothetical protein [Chelatococcus asaccharovorans]|uniref:Uncharacterized protein n=1 Tax=Chelatococcus asaccharovorans TaxID=28210 RepID=A0A2V3UBT0_9HYPH|nr:hypothetical protein [Chelatococcus asaccharovorans]MBS7703336.1 hypothetical protein [Chelatococcus asaccharovorans]PXW61671.1 hypothetical protein C7450_103188 [Chelatococcus asaccharovorans]